MSAQVYSLEGGAEVELVDRWLSEREVAIAFEELRDQVAWRQETIRMMGRDVLQPRLTAWYGDPDAVYTYSGLTNVPLPWQARLLDWRDRLRAELDHPFNSVLANLYRDERDSMGWHSDDERELGPEPIIASISLGTPRRFVLKHKKRRELSKLVLELGCGSLLVMKKATQRSWKHAVPREARARGARINLTYRWVRT